MKPIFLFLFAFTATLASAQSLSIETPPADTTLVFVRVQKEASFPGGIPAWTEYLKTSLKPEVAFQELPKKEKYFEQTVVVQFIVGKDGSISDVRTINHVLPSLKKEAERVIRQSGKWEPAEQNGRKVRAYRKQPITFIFSE